MPRTSQSESIVFAGPPSRLEGIIALHNTTAAKLKCRSACSVSGEVEGSGTVSVKELRLSARLRPGEQAMVPSTLHLDPGTPPGVYRLTSEVAGKEVTIEAHVSEVVDFRMEPSKITILAGKDRDFRRDFVIENRGNRPLPLGERCEAALFDSVDMVSAMVTGLAKAPSKSVQDRVESWLGEWAARHAGTLVVTREPMVLKPGQRVAASATFHLPKDLRPLGHFRTNLQLYNATLDVEIYTTRKEEASATA